MSVVHRPLDHIALLDPEPEFDRCLNAIKPLLDFMRSDKAHWRRDNRAVAAEYNSVGGQVEILATSVDKIYLTDKPTAISSKHTIAIVPLMATMANSDPMALPGHVLAILDAVIAAPRMTHDKSQADALPWMLAAMALAEPKGESDGVELATPWSPTRLEKVSANTPSIPPKMLAHFDAAMPMIVSAKADMINAQWRLTISPRFGWPDDVGEWHPDHDPLRTIRALAHVAAAGGLVTKDEA